MVKNEKSQRVAKVVIISMHACHRTHFEFMVSVQSQARLCKSCESRNQNEVQYPG